MIAKWSASLFGNGMSKAKALSSKGLQDFLKKAPAVDK
jgi:hypothetical protein